MGRIGLVRRVHVCAEAEITRRGGSGVADSGLKATRGKKKPEQRAESRESEGQLMSFTGRLRCNYSEISASVFSLIKLDSWIITGREWKRERNEVREE